MLKNSENIYDTNYSGCYQWMRNENDVLNVFKCLKDSWIYQDLSRLVHIFIWNYQLNQSNISNHTHKSEYKTN